MMSSIDDLWPFQRLGLLVSLNITIQKKKKKSEISCKKFRSQYSCFLIF